MTDPKFTFREIQPSDSPNLVKLITEFDGDMITQFLVDAYAALIFGTENQTTGVVVECAGFDDLVGLGTVRFSQVQYNGEILPLAFLDGLKVHKDFRGQGLGYQIASWRIQKAREAWGDRCVIATGLLRSNDASRAVASKWCKEFLDPAFQPVILPTRSHPPKTPAGIQVRQLEPHEAEEFALKQNAYYHNHNLYPPSDILKIAHALEVSAEGVRPYRFYTAVDSHGKLLAGAQIWLRGFLKSDRILNPPPPLRLINKAFHLLPPDFAIRDAAVIGLWYQAGQEKNARSFWEMLRWELKDQASTIIAALDPRDPLRKIITMKPWHQPRLEITVALHGPTAIDRERMFFGYGRI